MKQRYGERVLCYLPDNTICGLPAWIFNSDCAHLDLGVPLISIEALIELHRLLMALHPSSEFDKAGSIELPLEAPDETPAENGELAIEVRHLGPVAHGTSAGQAKRSDERTGGTTAPGRGRLKDGPNRRRGR